MAAGAPDIGSLLAGLAGGGGAPPMGGPMGPPPDMGQGGGDPVAILGDMLDMANEYLGVENDEEDKLLMQKVTTLLQQLRAKDQADKDAAMGGGNMRILRKAG